MGPDVANPSPKAKEPNVHEQERRILASAERKKGFIFFCLFVPFESPAN
jgi:hypothetical protein